MPSQCRADDGTELVGRYDRRMTEWMPLITVAITTVGLISVAIWNTRGESAAVRQLKGMNEVIGGLSATDDAAIEFIRARDGLLLRVAASVADAPRRRTIMWRAIGLGLTALVSVAVSIFLGPLLSDSASEVFGVIGAALAIVGAVVGWFAERRRTLSTSVD